MIFLTSINHTISLVTETTASVDWSTNYVDIDTITGAIPNSFAGTLTSSTTTTIVANPISDVQRQIKLITIKNTEPLSSSYQYVTVKKQINSSSYEISPRALLLGGETLVYIDSDGWQVLSVDGSRKTTGQTGPQGIQGPTGPQGQPGGQNFSLQFNSGSSFSGSVNLIYDYDNNVLSGTKATFTQITGSFSGSGANLNQIGNNSLVNDSVTIGTTLISLGDSVNQLSGLEQLTSSNITGTSAQFNTVTGNMISASTITSNFSGAYSGSISGTNAQFINGLFTDITGTNISSSISISNVITGTNISGTTVQFNTITGSNISSSTVTGTFSGSHTGSISGTTALFTNIVATSVTGNLNGTSSNSQLLDGFDSTEFVKYVELSSVAVTSITPGAGLSGAAALSGSVTLEVSAGDGITTSGDSVSVDNTVVRTTGNQTINGIKIFTNSLSGTEAYFSSNVIINGTASIGAVNTVNQQSLVIGDKYITILSGGVDHTTLDGSGILWGSGSTGPTVDELGANAHVRYRNTQDALEIYPNLYVPGDIILSGNLLITGSTTLQQNISGTNATFDSVTSSFSGDGSNLNNISRKLVNYINNGPAEEYNSAYLEITPTNSIFVTSSIWYTDNTKTKKIYEEYYERYSGSATEVKPNPIIYKLYKDDGVTVLIQATDTITYSSYGITNISRSLSSSY